MCVCVCVCVCVLTAFGLTPGDSSTVLIYTQTVHRTKQLIWEECGPCPVFASYTLAFALQLRKKHGKNSVRVAEECQYYIQMSDMSIYGPHSTASLYDTIAVTMLFKRAGKLIWKFGVSSYVPFIVSAESTA